MKKLRITTVLILFAFPSTANHSYFLNPPQSLDSEMREFKKNHIYPGDFRPKGSFAGRCILDKSEILDQTFLEAKYKIHIIKDTLDVTPSTDIIVLEIGKKHYKTYSEIGLQLNLNHTLFKQNKEKEQVKLDLKTYTYLIDYSIVRNLSNQTLTNRHLLPKVDNLIFEYIQPLPDFHWQQQPKTFNIAGYGCYKAVGQYAGRSWTVWFTPDIPVDGGLWKFNGLPGLILRAQDEKKHYVFELHSLQEVDKPMKLFTIRKKKITREKYLEKERLFHEHPVEQCGDIMIVEKDVAGNGGFYFMTNDWSIPYNPIELE